MIRSVLPVIKKFLLITLVALTIAINYCFTHKTIEPDWFGWTNRCLSQSFDPSGDEKLKKWELTLTSDSFIRLRKTYVKGRQEYFSFNLHKFNDMNYLGSTAAGTLELKTKADDIIVQTYNDKNGDVDSMTTVLNIPVRNMEPERLDSLRAALNYFKEKQL
jgi:hypothetical protein